MTKTLLVLSLALSLPALASDDPACVPMNSQTGDTVYYTPSTTDTAASQRTVRHDRVTNRTAAERRHDWLRSHMVNGPIYGNMARAPGDSSLGYMHGTDDPQGHMLWRDDEGPSSIHHRATAADESDDGF
jgi:hypothetical protein